MMTMRRAARWTPVLLLALWGLISLTGARSAPAMAEEKAVTVPAPAADEAAGQASSEIAVLAGGCFWGVQGVYQHVKGVTSAISGYTGGEKKNAYYEIVGEGVTGHAESVRILFDPRKITYGHLLQIFFSVVHDPTELNRQGPDFGTQYRSAIFPVNAEQERVARAYIAQLSEAKVFEGAIVTKVEPGKQFFEAEDYHQDFLENNRRYPYIVINDLPKIEALKKVFPEIYRPLPVLVGTH